MSVILGSVVWNEWNCGFRCLKWAKLRVPSSEMSEILGSGVWNEWNSRFRCLKWAKLRVPSSGMSVILGSGVWNERNGGFLWLLWWEMLVPFALTRLIVVVVSCESKLYGQARMTKPFFKNIVGALNTLHRGKSPPKLSKIEFPHPPTLNSFQIAPKISPKSSQFSSQFSPFRILSISPNVKYSMPPHYY